MPFSSATKKQQHFYLIYENKTVFRLHIKKIGHFCLVPLSKYGELLWAIRVDIPWRMRTHSTWLVVEWGKKDMASTDQDGASRNDDGDYRDSNKGPRGETHVCQA